MFEEVREFCYRGLEIREYVNIDVSLEISLENIDKVEMIKMAHSIEILELQNNVTVRIHRVLLYAFDENHVSAETKTFKDLFNSTSCAKPPFECPHPQIEFYLYTRETQKKPLRIDVRRFESLHYSRFNKSHPTKIIIHGFGGGRDLIPSPDIRKVDIGYDPIKLAWVRHSHTMVSMYETFDFSVFHARQLQYYNRRLRYLRDHPRGTRVENIHVLGYSVGAHIAGLIANYLPDDRLGRITDETDAHFVDVIHTGAGILGQWGPTGHVDFYVNGGSSQPGCATTSLLQTLSCDHTKVTPYYIESITTKVGFWAAPCGNLFSYLIGWCKPDLEEYILMGEDTPHTRMDVDKIGTERVQRDMSSGVTAISSKGYVIDEGLSKQGMVWLKSRVSVKAFEISLSVSFQISFLLLNRNTGRLDREKRKKQKNIENFKEVS
ncbi:Phospholipase A1 member A [Eufriesea mexicana]|uniref:phospholipase A1 n=1 Tax=Eufriesea mexicana TaxID=516756 RepID=A0A310S5K3_9HYME|nr:Phospholipase A1 member A [Eufriesea mexicana]